MSEYYVLVFVVGSVLHTLPEGKAVWGVTSLNNLLYVLRNKTSQQISVYDTDSYRLQRRLNVPRLDGMSDMTACACNLCIYISGGDDKCVHRVQVQVTGDFVTEWPVFDAADGLSITDTHSVLVTCRDVRKMKEFTTDGQLLRQIELPRKVVSPWHTIQLSSGEFLVCHGNIRHTQGVCLTGSDGHIVKSYSGRKRRYFQRISFFRMAVDRNGFIFVVDRNVILLSPGLTFVREVVSSDQLEWIPNGLFLDVDRRRLYVAENDLENDEQIAGRVVVFSV